MSGGGGGHDNTSEGLILVLFIFLAMGAIWYFFGTELKTAYLILKKGEILLLKYTGIPFLFPESWQARIVPALDLMAQKSVDAMSFAEVKEIGARVGYFSRWYEVAFVAPIAWRLLQKNPLQKFKRQHSMKTLAISEQKLWPAIAPVVKLNLVKEDINSGPWAMSKRPLDFARHYKLLDEDNKLNRNRAEKLFTAQLGKLWEGPNKMPSYARALFAIFAAQACGDIKGAKECLDLLSMTMADGKPDYSLVKGLLEKYGKNEKVQGICKRHAYVNTVLASMLKEARTFGVLASCQFIWLRPLNRPLWYTLNGVGRKVAFAEIAGIYGHWIAELVAEHPIERPYVIKAVDGLERALLEVKFDS